MTADGAEAKTVVARGYDRIAERYASWASGIADPSRERYTRLLLERLPPESSLLDLGCGGGGASTEQWAERFNVVGVDSSPRQIALARESIPNATFVVADMAELEFPPATFDGVAAFYSLIHVPREEHAPLLQRIAGWLRPGGLFVASMGASAAEGTVEPDWLCAPMFFSHFDASTNRRLVAGAGLTLESAEVATLLEYDQPAQFLWIVARA